MKGGVASSCHTPYHTPICPLQASWRRHFFPLGSLDRVHYRGEAAEQSGGDEVMPRVFTYRGYIFFFFSNEGAPLEPIHIHVRKDACLAKFWVEPSVQLAASHGFTDRELNRLHRLVVSHVDLIKERWHEHFGL